MADDKLRHWIADRLNAVSLWLEARSEAVSDMAYRIRPAVKPHPVLSEIILATLHHRSGKLAADVSRNNALLKSLKERNG
jgi:hypothetical protein